MAKKESKLNNEEVKKVANKYITTCSIHNEGKIYEPEAEYNGSCIEELLENGSIVEIE